MSIWKLGLLTTKSLSKLHRGVRQIDSTVMNYYRIISLIVSCGYYPEISIKLAGILINLPGNLNCTLSIKLPKHFNQGYWCTRFRRYHKSRTDTRRLRASHQKPSSFRIK